METQDLLILLKFEHEKCSIAYCESFDEEDKFIPLANKGNKFFRVDTKIGNVN